MTAFLVALSIIFQGTPVLLGEFGMIITPLATFPILLATYLNRKLGIIGYLICFFVLLCLTPEEAFIFFFTTGLLGISLGMFYRLRYFYKILFSSIYLTVGILCMISTIKFTMIGSINSIIDNVIVLIAIIFFSTIYTILIEYISKVLIKYLDHKLK